MMRPSVPLLGVMAILAALVLVPVTARAQEVRIVEASGQARIQSPADSDAARRRALGEALVSAALAGGAELAGYSAMAQGRIVRDVTVMRATAQVLSHEVLEARQVGDGWTLRIRARVAPLSAAHCAGGGRRLALGVEPPTLAVSPHAPTWAEALAATLAHGLIETAARHPRVSFAGVLPATPRSGPIPAALDYTALTRGVVAHGAGSHVLRLRISIAPQRDGTRQAVGLTAEMSLEGPDARVTERRVVTEARLPRGVALDALTGRSRSRAEAELAQGLDAALAALLEQTGCEAPAAILAASPAGLGVDIGRRDGLSPRSLGLVEGAEPADGLLEIVTLSEGRAELRPLDPTVDATRLIGARVRFVEAGFR